MKDCPVCWTELEHDQCPACGHFVVPIVFNEEEWEAFAVDSLIG